MKKQRILFGLCLLLLMVFAAGCANNTAKVTVLASMEENGLYKALVDAYQAKGKDHKVRTVTKKNEEDLYKALKDDKFEVALLLDNGTVEGRLANGGLTGGPAFFETLLLIGPVSDPAGVSQLTSIGCVNLCKHIALLKMPFIHVLMGEIAIKEAAIWEQTGITPQGPWYMTASSIADLLAQAESKNGYALIERAAWIEQSANYEGKLKVIASRLDGMVDQYYILAPPLGKKKAGPAQAFVAFVLSAEGQAVIANYNKAPNGEPQYLPNDGEPGIVQPATATPAP